MKNPRYNLRDLKSSMFALLFAMIVLWLQGGAEQGLASVQGVVVRSGSTEPISQVRVVLIPAGGSTGRDIPATTSEDGRFVMLNVPPGKYRLTAARDGGEYAPAEYGQRHAKGHGVVFTIAPGQQLKDVALAMVPTGSISGRIVDERGDPVPNARVMALEAVYSEGRRELRMGQAVRSNDLGEYRLFWLPAGRYYIGVQPVDPRGNTFAVHVVWPEAWGPREDATSPVVTRRITDEGEIVEETQVMVYYGGSRDSERAVPIDLSSGANIGAIDISLEQSRVRTRRIRGVVLNAGTGAPVENASVWLVPRNAAPHLLIANARTDRAGAFEIAGAIPGSYVLYGVVNMRILGTRRGTVLDITDGLSGRTTIDVADNDIENVTVAVQRSFTLSGRVLIESDTPGTDRTFLRAMHVGLTRYPSVLGMPASESPAGSGNVSSEGEFVIRGFGPGDYRVEAAVLPRNAYVRSVRFGAEEILGGGFRLEGPPQASLEVVVSFNGGTLEGTTVDASSEPLENVTVVLVPDGPFRERRHLYRTAVSDASGRFEMTGIAPGGYKLYAWDAVEEGAWHDPEFIRRHEASGRPVRLDAGARLTINLNTIRGVR